MNSSVFDYFLPGDGSYSDNYMHHDQGYALTDIQFAMDRRGTFCALPYSILVTSEAFFQKSISMISQFQL